MRYVLSRRDKDESVFIRYYDDFQSARRNAVALMEQGGYSIVGYHLTEVHNAPLHAELFGAKLDAHIILTISEAE